MSPLADASEPSPRRTVPRLHAASALPNSSEWTHNLDQAWQLLPSDSRHCRTVAVSNIHKGLWAGESPRRVHRIWPFASQSPRDRLNISHYADLGDKQSCRSNLKNLYYKAPALKSSTITAPEVGGSLSICAPHPEVKGRGVGGRRLVLPYLNFDGLQAFAFCTRQSRENMGLAGEMGRPCLKIERLCK